MTSYQPRYPGRVFHRDDLEGMFAYGVGGMMWGEENGHKVLRFLAPGRKGARLHRIFIERDETDWSRHGVVHAWDGDEESPTLSGSIQLDRNGWHGYIANGNLVTGASIDG